MSLISMLKYQPNNHGTIKFFFWNPKVKWQFLLDLKNDSKNQPWNCVYKFNLEWKVNEDEIKILLCTYQNYLLFCNHRK